MLVLAAPAYRTAEGASVVVGAVVPLSLVGAAESATHSSVTGDVGAGAASFPEHAAIDNDATAIVAKNFGTAPPSVPTHVTVPLSGIRVSTRTPG